MPAKKRPKKVFLGQLDYCKNEYQKRKLLETLSGPVKVSNLYDNINNIPPIEKLIEMKYDVARSILLIAKEKHTTVNLRKYWKIPGGKMYQIFRDYDIQSKRVAVNRIENTNITKLDNHYINNHVNKLSLNLSYIYNKNNFVDLINMLNMDAKYEINISIKQLD